MKILIIQNRIGIGDMIIFLPFVEAISKKFGVPVSCLLKKNTKADQILKNNNIPFKILERSPQYQKKGDRTVALTKQSIILLNKLFPDIDINKYSTPVSKMSLFHESKKNLILKSDEVDKVLSLIHI